MNRTEHDLSIAALTVNRARDGLKVIGNGKSRVNIRPAKILNMVSTDDIIEHFKTYVDEAKIESLEDVMQIAEMAALVVDKITTSKLFMLQADEEPIRYERCRHGIKVNMLGRNNEDAPVIRYDDVIDQTQGLDISRTAQKKSRRLANTNE